MKIHITFCMPDDQQLMIDWQHLKLPTLKIKQNINIAQGFPIIKDQSKSLPHNNSLILLHIPS